MKSKWGQGRSEVESSPVVTPVGQWKYVASRQSEVFNRPDCKWVGRISAGNLIGFGSRKEALAGRRGGGGAGVILQPTKRDMKP